MRFDADLARLCADSYLPCCGNGVEVGPDLAAIVIERDADVVVAFRGTANPQGWLRDIDALPKSHPMIGNCHRGFLTGGIALAQKIVVPDGKRVVLAGHSLGGSLAIVFGALRIATGLRVDELVTFGAPRAGWERLAEIWAPITVRQYANGNDPVPDVPITLLFSPYQHVRALTRIGIANLQEPWKCHAIQLYAKLVGYLPEV